MNRARLDLRFVWCKVQTMNSMKRGGVMKPRGRSNLDAQTKRPDAPIDDEKVFRSVFSCAMGGCTIGAMFGVVWLFVGGVLGGAFGYYIERKNHG